MKSTKRNAVFFLPFVLFALSAQAETVTGNADATADQAATDVAASEAHADEVTSAAAQAAEDENVVDTVKITPAKAPNALVCRSERPIGSHIPKRVCRTNQQIAEERANAKDKFLDSERFQQRRSLGHVRKGHYNMKAYKAGKY